MKRAHPCQKSLYDGHGLRPFAHPTFTTGNPLKVVLFGSQSEIQEWSAVPNAFITTALREGKVLYEKPA